jgi:hypothetical protein
LDAVTGEYPTKRYGHQSAMVGRMCVVFGGWSGVRRCKLCNVVLSKGVGGGGALEHQPGECPCTCVDGVS